VNLMVAEIIQFMGDHKLPVETRTHPFLQNGRDGRVILTSVKPILSNPNVCVMMTIILLPNEKPKIRLTLSSRYPNLKCRNLYAYNLGFDWLLNDVARRYRRRNPHLWQSKVLAFADIAENAVRVFQQELSELGPETGRYSDNF